MILAKGAAKCIACCYYGETLWACPRRFLYGTSLFQKNGCEILTQNSSWKLPQNLWSISKHILNILGFKKDWTFLSKNMGTRVPSMCFLRIDNWIIRHGPHKTSQQKLIKASEMKGLGYTLQKAKDCLLLLCEPLLKQASCSLPWPSLSVSWESHFTMFKYAQTDFLGKQ